MNTFRCKIMSRSELDKRFEKGEPYVYGWWLKHCGEVLILRNATKEDTFAENYKDFMVNLSNNKQLVPLRVVEWMEPISEGSSQNRVKMTPQERIEELEDALSTIKHLCEYNQFENLGPCEGVVLKVRLERIAHYCDFHLERVDKAVRSV